MALCPNCKEEYEPNPLEPHRLTCSGGTVKLSEYILRSAINVGERFREEYKGIEELATSIQKFGLLQYPVIDQDNNLHLWPSLFLQPFGHTEMPHKGICRDT